MKLDLKTVGILLVAGYLGYALGERFLPETVKSMIKGA